MNSEYISIFPDMFLDIENYADIKKILEKASDVLSSAVIKLGEVANELNCFEEVPKEDSYVHVVISLFVRKLMEQVDAINILYSYGSVTEAEVILRSMLETVVALKFILNEDETDREITRFRAAAYFMGHQYQELYIANKHTRPGGILEGKISSEDQQKLNAKRVALNNMINRNKYFKHVDDERSKLKNSERANWYEPAGVHNYRELMDSVGMSIYYDGLYSPLSFESHAYNVAMAMKVKEDGFYPDLIRMPQNGANTFSLVCSFVAIALKSLYGYLGDGDEEKLEFAKFYMEFIERRDCVEKELSKRQM